MKQSCNNWKDHLSAGKVGSHFYEEFEARAKGVSAEVFRIRRANEIANIILDIVNETGAKSVAVVSCPLIEASGLVNDLRDKGVAVYTDQIGIAENISTTDIGISGVEFGIAECGSVCQDALAIETRLVSALPPLHIAIMESSNIVPTIDDAVDIISGFFTEGYISWITGPSRTADIERVLTIGVHGPARLIIIVADEVVDGGDA